MPQLNLSMRSVHVNSALNEFSDPLGHALGVLIIEASMERDALRAQGRALEPPCHGHWFELLQ